MDKSFLKYLPTGGLILSGKMFGSVLDPHLGQDLMTKFDQQNLQMIVQNADVVLYVINCLHFISGTAICSFLEKNKEELEKMNLVEEKRIEALKAQIEQENKKIIEIWGSLDEWDRIYNIMENPAYEIAGKSHKDTNNRRFFSDLCTTWSKTFDGKNFEQKGEMLRIDGFLYGLAIMLINANELFRGEWQPLANLCMVTYGEKFCDFSNPQAMKEKGMEIMKTIRNYNLAYVYLGNTEE
ncbi:MAG: hypothetical protein LBR92_03510 [Puniceicoccales bacterium]|jgi:hypothetical protein|nr:hypothetical protein [Puniceicoccales bacterium]